MVQMDGSQYFFLCNENTIKISQQLVRKNQYEMYININHAQRQQHSCKNAQLLSSNCVYNLTSMCARERDSNNLLTLSVNVTAMRFVWRVACSPHTVPYRTEPNRHNHTNVVRRAHGLSIILQKNQLAPLIHRCTNHSINRRRRRLRHHTQHST